MLAIQNLGSFLLASGLVIALPGPATFYVLGRARLSPYQAGLAALGIISGDVILIALSGLGFSALVLRWPLLLTAIKLAGAAYVAWLGWSLLRAKPAAGAGKAEDAAAPAGRVVVQGLLITLSNPKPILFFAAFFPMFIRSGMAAPGQCFYALGACFEALNLAYFGGLTLAMAQARRSAWLSRWLDGRFQAASGLGLLGCAGLVFASAWN